MKQQEFIEAVRESSFTQPVRGLRIDNEMLTIEGASLGTVALHNLDFVHLTFRNCHIVNLHITESCSGGVLVFENCTVDYIGIHHSELSALRLVTTNVKQRLYVTHSKIDWLQLHKQSKVHGLEVVGTDVRLGMHIYGGGTDFARYRETVIAAMDLNKTDVSNTTFENAVLLRPVWSHVRMRDSGSAESLIINGGHFSDVDVYGSVFEGLQFINGVTLNEGASFSGCTMSGAKGFPDQTARLLANFRVTTRGEIVVYKTFNFMHPSPEDWVIEPGAVIREVANLDPSTDCGSGINVATARWIYSNNPHAEVWECRIPVGAQWVLPHASTGKMRTNRLRLVHRISYDRLRQLANAEGYWRG